MADTPVPFDAAEIRRLVEEVVRRITADGSGTAVAVPPRTAPVADTLAVVDPVVTLGLVERLPGGIRRLAVPMRAVITPSARDRARERGIAIVRDASPAAGSRPAAAIPFLVACAECRRDAEDRGAAIVRAVPGSRRLPHTDLIGAVAALAGEASRDGARGVLLTSRPALGVVVANRSPSLRAVTGRDAAALVAAAADCAANLLVIDPLAFTGGLDRACIEFAGRPGGAVPAALAQNAPGCACKTHPH